MILGRLIVTSSSNLAGAPVIDPCRVELVRHDDTTGAVVGRATFGGYCIRVPGGHVSVAWRDAWCRGRSRSGAGAESSDHRHHTTASPSTP